MGLLSEAAKYKDAVSPIHAPSVTDLTPDDLRAYKRTADRAQQLETAWHGLARTIDHRLTIRRDRSRRIELLACAIGGAGLITVFASQFQRLIPYEYGFTLTVIGVIFALAPLLTSLWPVLQEGRPEGDALESTESHARASKAFGRKLTQSIEHARLRGTWTTELRQAFEGLLDSMEADVAKLKKDLGISSIEGRKHRRIVPRQRKVVIKTRDGRSMTGQIADISLSGVALADQLPRVAVRDEILINGRAATIVRIWKDGVALEFKQQLNPEIFNEDIIL